MSKDRSSMSSSSSSLSTFSIPTPNTNLFPTGALARRELKRTLLSSTDPIETISTFATQHSLHSYLSKAFGTIPRHGQSSNSNNTNNSSSSSSSGGGGSKKLKLQLSSNDGNRNNNNEVGMVAEEEPFDPTAVLQFLSHLGVSRYEVHKRVSDALRMELEQEMAVVNTSEDDGKDVLLELLKNAWQFQHISTVQSVLVSVMKRLGQDAPKEALQRLAQKDSKTGELKYITLLNQFDWPMKRLVWEADWEANIYGDGTFLSNIHKNANDSSNSSSSSSPTHNNTSTPQTQQQQQQQENNNSMKDDDDDSDSHINLLHQTNRILCDMIRPAVEQYCNDASILSRANTPFLFLSVRDKRIDTVKRRAAPTYNTTTTASTNSSSSNSTLLTSLTNNNNNNNSTSSSNTTNTKQSSSNNNKINDTNNNNNDNNTSKSSEPPSTRKAISIMKEVIGKRPKLLAACLNMLLNQYALTSTATNNSHVFTLLGGSSHLYSCCVMDLLLTYGKLPRPYEHVGLLAGILDNSVKIGFLTDDALAQIQGCLAVIFKGKTTNSNNHKQTATNAINIKKVKKTSLTLNVIKPSSKTNSNSNTKSSSPKTKSLTKTKIDDRPFELKLIRKIVESSVIAMKDCDHQGLFLNPVTDDIAPGYSSLIDNPMCIRTIEEKAVNMDYSSMQQFESDVKTMYQNCIAYNIGKDGEWFRGEAKRQMKIFHQEINKQAKKQFKTESNKRKKALESATALKKQQEKQKESSTATKKRKIEAMTAANSSMKHKMEMQRDHATAIPSLKAKDIIPLPASHGQRISGDIDHPSMPALASFLLIDPFVIRLILDKMIKTMKKDFVSHTTTMAQGQSLGSKDKTVPVAHPTLPSLLQLLHVAASCQQLCRLRGKRYVMPSCGSEQDDNKDVLTHSALRKYIPLITQLFLECDLDRRTSPGGDLYDAERKGLLPARPKPKSKRWKMPSSSTHDHPQSDHTNGNSKNVGHLFLSDPTCVPRVLVQGAMVHVMLQLESSPESAWIKQISRFATALEPLYGNMSYEGAFFNSYIQTILRHKSKLPHGVRDTVCKLWLDWFSWHNQFDTSNSCMCLPVHEYYIRLLNEWASLGNMIMPRDKLIESSMEAALMIQESTTIRSRSNTDGESPDVPIPLKSMFAYYWIVSKNIPSSNSSGVTDNDMKSLSPSSKVDVPEFISSIDKMELEKVSSFQPICHQYERILNSIPEKKSEEWKQKLGIDDSALEALAERIQKEEAERKKLEEKRERKKRRKTKLQLQQPSSSS